MFLYINCLEEAKPGEQWKRLFEKSWPYYRKWFVSEGLLKRVGYTTSYRKLKEYMPELVPTYDALVELAGGGDVVARFLSSYCPPPYLSGCSQAIWKKDGLSLIRNYDYSPYYFEGVVLYSNWLRPVIAMSDCNWGVLDGINDGGLSISLTFGGSQVLGKGFGVPLLIRYLLETCDTIEEVSEKVNRIPVHMAYNLTVLEASGKHATIFLAPDKAPLITEELAITNHQDRITWPAYAKMSATLERHTQLLTNLDNPYETQATFLSHFLTPPLYQTRFEKGFGTLYTAQYFPKEKKVGFYWQQKQIFQSFENFESKHFTIELSQGRTPRIMS
jgi:predicted choloylglycine hydrolase